MRLKLGNFNVVKINSIIGHYNDIKHQEKNIFEEDIIDDKGNIKTIKNKKFKRFAINMTLSPKNPINYIVSSDDYEIGDFKDKKVDIIPFVKDDKFYYSIRDHNLITATVYYDFNIYYKHSEGSNIIKDRIRNPYKEIDGKRILDLPVYSWDGSKEQLETCFITSKRFNYTNYIEWTAD